ncbi:MAG: TlpA family protein disulfide reductase [Chloroflexi bacterium]|nr:TlpA family protein disulfide reductase [Chloroflexota bacterium]MBF6606819.1 TlpA family protein disulfide reductase [Chloroflexota bacterium]
MSAAAIRSSRSRLLASLVVGVAVVGVMALVAVGFARDPGRIESPLVGRVAPEFRLVSLGGTTIDLADLRGRPVVLNFWASWCIPCRDEAPLLRAAQERYATLDVAFLGVVYEDSAASAQAFVDRYGIAYPSLLDPDGRTALDYGVYGIPETYFIAADGTIRDKQIGPLDATSLERQIGAVLR